MAKIYFHYDRNPLQFLLSSKLNVVLNHEETFTIKSKVETVKDVPSGKVFVQISAPYYGSEIGKVKEEFDVNQDDIVHVSYRPPFFVFSSGTIFIEKGEKRSKKSSNLFEASIKMIIAIGLFILFIGLIFDNLATNLFNLFNLSSSDVQIIDSSNSSQDSEKDVSSLTVNQENALKKAKQYIKVLPFSKSGLIQMLESEGFSTEDAIIAVDNMKVDWLKQAELKVEQYLTVMGFSKSGLIQMLEFDGFNTEEATSAVNNMTIDWLKQAELKARQYLIIMPFSKDGLIQQLEFDGFTREEAEHGAYSTGLR